MRFGKNKNLIFNLIHIQHIQPSDGAKWDVLFLRIIKDAPSFLHPTIKLN